MLPVSRRCAVAPSLLSSEGVIFPESIFAGAAEVKIWNLSRERTITAHHSSEI